MNQFGMHIKLFAITLKFNGRMCKAVTPQYAQLHAMQFHSDSKVNYIVKLFGWVLRVKITYRYIEDPIARLDNVSTCNTAVKPLEAA
jgi:hypothetical protein